ncbi:MAG: subclass B3 metallo-beta-lactamase [Myxococcales bacterium]
MKRLGFLLVLSLLHPARATTCKDCAKWNETQAPFRIYGNAYYVGVRGLSSVLITSEKGHVLIDGALPESAAKIAASIEALGFRLQDVKLILNSHVHFDHAGGIAELQRRTGARVASSKPSAIVLRRGTSGPDDPQFGAIPPLAPVARVDEFEDGETLRVGSLAVTAHLTPGHTPGGTSWTWTSCEVGRCLDVVYADSLTPVSAPRFQFTRAAHALESFEKSFATLSALPCDILVSTHPDASSLWKRLASRDGGNRDALIERQACAKYAEAARAALRERIASENPSGEGTPSR